MEIVWNNEEIDTFKEIFWFSGFIYFLLSNFLLEYIRIVDFFQFYLSAPCWSIL